MAKEITDDEGFTIKQIVEGSQKSFGQNLCFTCAKKISDKKKEIEKAKNFEEEGNNNG